MKLMLVTVTSALLAFNAHSQSASSSTSAGAGAQGGASVGAEQPAQPAQPAVPPQAPPPGLENREQLPPGLEKREELPPGLEKRDWSAQTNQSAMQTNQFGGPGMSPTSTNSQNRIYNSQSFSNNANASADANASATIRNTTTIEHDVATTPADKTLLVDIRQQAQTIINQFNYNSPGSSVNVAGTTTTAGTAPTSPAFPVSFAVAGGVVRIMGIVPNVQESRRVETVVRRVPGVTRVVNELRVDANAQSRVSTSVNGVNSTISGATTQSGAAGGTSMSATNNFSPTGRTNSGALQPGLSRQTNSPGTNP